MWTKLLTQIIIIIRQGFWNIFLIISIHFVIPMLVSSWICTLPLVFWQSHLLFLSKHRWIYDAAFTWNYDGMFSFGMFYWKVHSFERSICSCILTFVVFMWNLSRIDIPYTLKMCLFFLLVLLAEKNNFLYLNYIKSSIYSIRRWS